jgi:amino acid adenylation domain-containing protein
MPQSLIEDAILELYPAFPESSGEVSPSLRGPRLDQFLDRSFPQLFAEQVERHPNQIAVTTPGGRLSFAELNAGANQLAHHLRSLGVGRESLVAICIDRSLEMAIGIVGILKSGGAYLPLDPDYPKERLAFMLRDAQPSVIVTKSELVGLLPVNNSQVVLLDHDRATIQANPQTDPVDAPLSSDLAYVIYTSGSTGTPKGVMIEHGNLANYLLGLNHELQITSDDVYLHLASIAFSSSRRQLLLPLSQGATVVIANSEQRKDPLALFEMIKQGGITVMDAVPSFWRSCTTILQELDLNTQRALLNNKLRLMLSASEPLLSDIPRTWSVEFQHPARHVHMFGQTETAGIVCTNELAIDRDGAEPTRISIGRPIANTAILILDEQMNPSPIGTAGELYIGGAGVGRGYLNRPDLTAEKFIVNPSNNGRGARLYRTGDWARLREDGRLEFAGRRDQQIKIRGFRVELAEVEAALAKHPGVREAAVVARPHADGNQKLFAYFVGNGSSPAGRELRDFLKTELPDYAIPSVFVRLDALPLSANGKVDRRALVEAGAPTFQATTEYIAPRTEIEEQLATIWQSVLRVDRVGIDDNFFELGGNSLLAGQAIARVRRMLSVHAPVTWIFESPTVRALAAMIASAEHTNEFEDQPLTRVSRERPLPLSFAQQRLWFLEQLDPGNYAYNIAHAMEITGGFDTNALRKALNEIVARHEVLRTRFVEIDGTPFQKIDESTEANWQFIDLTNRTEEALKFIDQESRRPFDLALGPLFRARLAKIAADKFILLLVMHHIVTDGWSAELLANELSALYKAFVTGETASLPDLPIQYADYAAWQSQRAANGKLQDQIDYWKRQLSDAPPVLNLPTDHPRGAPSYRGGKQTALLSRELSDEIRKFARAHGATLFMTLLAVFDCLLALYCGSDDVVVGSPVAGRDGMETELLMGFFVNTLALRIKISPEESVRQLMRQVREAALAAFANQDVPFEMLVTALQHDRSAEHNPIFQVMFLLQNEKQPLPTFPGATVHPLKLDEDTSKFDLSLEAVDAEELEISIAYSEDLFEAESARCMLADYQRLIEAFIANADTKMSELPALTWTAKYLPARNSSPASNKPAEYVAPRTPIEEKLAAIWTAVLAVERVGVEDNFFMLGGHSLLAAQVISRIRDSFNYELPLRRLFETPTVAGLAEAICESHAATTEDDELQAMLAELETLSDDEAQRQFATERAV